jgi:Ca-activated chloride channel family protein
MMFERSNLLWLVPLITIAVGAVATAARRRRLTAARAWSTSLGAQAARYGRRSPLLLAAAACLAAIGLAGPRWGRVARTAESRALNVALVMDISRSMLAQDAAPDRLTRSIRIARRLVQDLSGDRLALVVFAQRAYMLAPLTLDESALALQLDALDPTIASEGGSGLAGALTMARELLLEASEGGDRAVVVFTDGESFDGENALTAAAAALRDDGIALVTVPVGTSDGTRIPDGRGGWHRDALGEEVMTRRRDDLIAAMQEAAEGTVIAADAPDPAGEVRRALERLDRATVRDQLAADLVPRAWLFALGALLLIGVQTVTRRTASLVGVALCLAAGTAQAQRPSRGIWFLGRGDTARATTSFLAEAQRIGSDTSWYNAGTAALIAGDLAAGTEALNRATFSLDPQLRRRALYNLGTSQLLLARGDSTGGDSVLGAAVASLRQALQLDPGDSAAKYNYELARRLMPPPPPPQGGGGGEQDPQDDPSTPPPAEPRSGMSQAEAEQVLNAMERAERETRRELAKRQRRTPVREGPDW